MDELFASFEAEPVGAASIAQAHRATLIDGRSVIVKVCFLSQRDCRSVIVAAVLLI